MSVVMFSGTLCENNARSIRLMLRALALIGVCILLVPEKGYSQTVTGEDVIAEMAQQQKMITIFRSLEREVRNHYMAEMNAILSRYGGWNSIERLSGDGGDAYRFRESSDDFRLGIVNIRRDIGRVREVSEEQLQDFNNAIGIFEQLIDDGIRISEALDDGRVDDANQYYFEVARIKYLEIDRALYTLIVTAERNVADLARSQRN